MASEEEIDKLQERSIVSLSPCFYSTYLIEDTISPTGITSSTRNATFLNYRDHIILPNTIDIIFHTGYSLAAYSITDHPELIRKSCIEGLVFDAGSGQYSRRTYSAEQMRRFWDNVGLRELLEELGV